MPHTAVQVSKQPCLSAAAWPELGRLQTNSGFSRGWLAQVAGVLAAGSHLVVAYRARYNSLFATGPAVARPQPPQAC